MPSDSMSIGVAGMDAYQAQIDVISNNIANVGTTAYKSQSLNFQDLLYQTQQTASAPTKTNGGINSQQVGIGVKIGSTDTNMNQGGVQTTGVNTNMMINGDGYFILNNADGTGSAKYTRNGDFSLNQTGLLFDPSSGLGVMGYTANAQGIVSPTGSPGPLQIPIGLKSLPIATGQGVKQGAASDKVFDMSFGGNLDATQYAAAVSNSPAPLSPANFATAGTTIYDSLGSPHLVNITFQPQITNGGVAGTATMPFQVNNTSGLPVTAATEWAYTVSSTDGTKFGGGLTTTPLQYAFFDQNGQYINTSGIVAPLVGVPLGAPNVHQLGGAPSAASGCSMTVTQWGAPPGANNSATPPSVGPIGIDFSLMTANAANSQVLSIGQNGVSPGTLSNVSVSQDGTLTGAFTNGKSLTLGRVAVATFQNQQGLTRLGGSLLAASADSGEVQVGSANTGRFGSIAGDAVEMSNVSIADEFTKLIMAQNAFTANSKSITTANNDLQTVIGLIR